MNSYRIHIFENYSEDLKKMGRYILIESIISKEYSYLFSQVEQSNIKVFSTV